MRADARSLAALVAVQVLFGLHYPAAKALLETIPPQPWAFVRAASAGLILLVVARARGTRLPRDGPTLARLAGLGLLGVAINQWLFVEGLHRTTPGHSALINTSMPVMVALLASLVGQERPSARRWTGIGITMLGILVLVGPTQSSWDGASLTGDLLTLVNALSYSSFLVLGKPVLEKVGTVAGSTLLLALGGLWLAPVGLPDLIRETASGAVGLDARTVLLAGFIVLGPTIGAYGLNTYALRRVDSSLVAFFIYLQPLIGVGLSLLLGFERATPRLGLAAAIVFAGVFVALRSPLSPGGGPPRGEPPGVRGPLPGAALPEP